MLRGVLVLLTVVLGLGGLAFGLSNRSQGVDGIVLTTAWPSGRMRPGDSFLVTELMRTLIGHEAVVGRAPRVIFEGRGPTTVPWVFCRFLREPEFGAWRMWVEVRYPNGSARSASASGRPASALRQALCAAGVLTCDGR